MIVENVIRITKDCNKLSQQHLKIIYIQLVKGILIKIYSTDESIKSYMKKYMNHTQNGRRI